jgi:outer membrane protein assembly factor BamB
MKKSTLLALTIGVCAIAGTTFAADWPQWRGPDRTDVSKETGLLKTWPEGGPKLLWTFNDAGTGFSGPAVVGDVLYTMGGDDKKEYVFALDTKTQKKLWNTEIGDFFTNGYGDGPRGTPTVDGDLIFCLNGKGNLVCVDRASGDKKWSVSLTGQEIGGNVPYWGYSESPLVDGDRLIVSPGGKKGGMIALNKKTGAVEWQCKEYTEGNPGYASAIVAEVEGVRQYVRTTMSGVMGIDAKTGKQLWFYRGNGFKTAVIPTPIYKDGFVYAAAGYGAGCNCIKLTKDGDKFKAEKAYANTNMDNKHGGVLLVGDHLYGFSDKAEKREDEGKWLCQDFKTGDVSASKKYPKGSLTYADGHLYLYGEGNGTCMLVEATPDMKECGTFKIPQQTKIKRKNNPSIWTHPVVANGKLYLRDQELLFCYDVKDAK